MYASVEIAHDKEYIPFLNYYSNTQLKISAYKTSLELITNQLQNTLIKLKQIYISKKYKNRFVIGECYWSHVLLEQFRYILTQTIDIVSGVNMSDIATRVGIATVELGVNKMNELLK